MAELLHGTRPADHGWYSYLMWRPERMELARPTPDYLPGEAFWREPSREGPRGVALDVPRVYPPQAFNRVEIA
ncbi:MAG: hypothetical protein ACE5JR_08260, partial [Gemmatimonadota bacterium]